MPDAVALLPALLEVASLPGALILAGSIIAGVWLFTYEARAANDRVDDNDEEAP